MGLPLYINDAVSNIEPIRSPAMLMEVLDDVASR